MQFEGNCLLTELKNNVMTDSYNAINFVEAQFSPQGTLTASWANEWINTSNPLALRVGGSFDPSINKQWFFEGPDNDEANEFSPYPYEIDIVAAEPNTDNGSFNCDLENIVAINERRDFTYAPLLADTITYEVSQYEKSYLAKESLFKKISIDTTRLTVGSPLDSVFNDFYQTMLAANVGNFDSVSRAMALNDYTAARTHNALITDTNGIEFNNKLINNIYLIKIIVDSLLDGSDSIAVEDIYNSHWNSSGLAVYPASAILFEEFYSSSVSLREIQVNENPSLKKPDNKKDIVVYPNPANNKLYLRGELPHKAFINLFDSSGRLVKSSGVQNEIDISEVEEGFYILKVIIDKSTVFNKNVVIIK